ncbi:Rne/Rng family ribonuclease [Acetobacteraceae bacterium ESL0709]|nr:Rne/Rng family ribonuclease [Acetobacteraceae bacterium ESL0697]MDF7677657.1 Rne/Rng family ribonuclease [Acetobacteraceae bacterium ESL0709]
MTKHMLIDATHAEETRVVVMNGRRIDDYDVESSARRQLKGNIYLAKVIRVEPSLQAAFVDYGGNRHGFLAFSEIHPDYFQIPVADREKLLALQEEEAQQDQISEQIDAPAEEFSETENDSYDEDEDESPEMVSGEHDTGDEETASRRTSRFLRNYRIQEVIRRRQIILVQVVKEERGNKGAALTTYISLAGRYCVLMPNALRGGGVSRKITSDTDRKRLKDIISQLDLPRSMAMIIRTAGAGRPEQEIIKDCDYLLQLWDDIRAHALSSIAPVLVYEEATLIKRAIRDLFSRDIEDIYIDGEKAWKSARDFARLLIPHNARKIKLWQNRGQTLFSYYNVEAALDAMYSPVAQLESGGYLVINQTEALVSIDVNSGKSTSQRNIEETAVRTNLEAADEIARQLRLRDLAGLIVIDFIDMESRRHNMQVERRLKDALKQDRARIQIGRISHFGLLEMSRQRLHPSLAETMLTPCPHCHGTGTIRGTESNALHVLRTIEEEAARHQNATLYVSTLPEITLYMLNAKREWLGTIEAQHNVTITFKTDATLSDNPSDNKVRIEWVGTQRNDGEQPAARNSSRVSAPEKIRTIEIVEGEIPSSDLAADTLMEIPEEATSETGHEQGGNRRRRRRNGRRNNQGRDRQEQNVSLSAENDAESEVEDKVPERSSEETDVHENEEQRELAPGRRRTRMRRLNNPRRERHQEDQPDDQSARQTPVRPVYQGPTPADPFGGFDIFEAIEQHDEQELAEAVRHEKEEPLKERARSRSSETHPARSHKEAKAQQKVEDFVEPEQQEAHEVSEAEPAKPTRRRRRTTKTMKDEKTQENTASEASSEEAAPVEAKPVRKRRTTTRRKKADSSSEASSSEANPSPMEENSAAPQPIDVDEAQPAKRRVGWWRR